MDNYQLVAILLYELESMEDLLRLLAYIAAVFMGDVE